MYLLIFWVYTEKKWSICSRFVEVTLVEVRSEQPWQGQQGGQAKEASTGPHRLAV